MGLRRTDKVIITGGFAAVSPNDSTTYYFSTYSGSTWTSTEARERTYVPCKLRITDVYLRMFALTPGSNESCTYLLRTNNTTDHTLFSGGFDASGNTSLSANDLDITLNKGEYFNFKITTPAWATNPANIYATILIYAEILE